MYSALNDYYLEAIGKECLGRTFNTEKVISTEWDMGSSDEISKIELIMRYQADVITERYIICTTNIDAINIKELHKDNIIEIFQSKVESMTSTQSYSFMYDTTIQTDRGALTKAICDKVFGENASATRYIVDNGYKVDNTLNEAREFKVVEITDTGIQEISIRIKYSSNNDEDYIANLENQSNYRTFSEKSYTLSGNKISQ